MGLTSISYLDDPIVEHNGEIVGHKSDLIRLPTDKEVADYAGCECPKTITHFMGRPFCQSG